MDTPAASHQLQETTAKLLLGIDVSKNTLDGALVWRSNRRILRRLRCANTPTGHRLLLRQLHRLVRTEPSLEALTEIHLVCEATGNYHLRLVTTLCQAGLPVSVVNPLQTKRFSQMRLRQSKTDRSDALLIALYGATEPMRRYRPMPRAQQHLRQITRTLAQLAKQRTALGNMLEASSYLPQESALCREQIEAICQQISASIKRLEAEQQRLARTTYGETYRLLRSIPGIGPKISGAVIGYGADLSGFETAKQFASYAGLVPRAWQSGQVDAPRHITKAGHAPLRTLLYLGSLSAIRHNRSCREFYAGLLARGKKPKVALIAVANKLLRQIFGVVKSGVAYDPEYELKYAQAA